ncbi:MAG: acyl carrier protein [Firmicutes bacterium]|nr:acyl carrier protein [Bacillota bacterium]
MDSSRIYQIIAEQLGSPVAEIKGDATFADLGADSLDLFQIVSALEEEFELEFDIDDTEKIKTVGDVVEYIKAMVE